MGRLISAFMVLVAFFKGNGSWKAAMEAIADLLREAAGQIPEESQPQAVTSAPAVECGDPVAFMETAIENHKAGRQAAINWATLLSLAIQLLGKLQGGGGLFGSREAVKETSHGEQPKAEKKK